MGTILRILGMTKAPIISDADLARIDDRYSETTVYSGMRLYTACSGCKQRRHVSFACRCEA